MGKMNNKIGKMLSRESVPSVDERGLSTGLRSILSKQAGTSVFKKYSQPKLINEGDRGESFQTAVEDASKRPKSEDKEKPKKNPPSNENENKDKKEKELAQAVVINVDKDGKEEIQDQTGLGVSKMGNIYEPNMQDDVNISSSSVVQGQDGNPGDVTVEDNTLMKKGTKDDRYVSKKEFKNVIKEETGMGVREWRKYQKKHAKGSGSKNDPIRANF